MKCLKCGRLLEPSDDFCKSAKCGQPSDRVMSVWIDVEDGGARPFVSNSKMKFVAKAKNADGTVYKLAESDGFSQEAYEPYENIDNENRINNLEKKIKSMGYEHVSKDDKWWANNYHRKVK
jgi:hypothetical protein